MKRGKVFVSLIAFVLFLSSLALSNGLNLNSLGTRAIAMGGAFVGLADDYSAIFWNPAGIAQFKQKTFGFSGDDIIPSSTYKFDAALVNASSKNKHYLVGMAGYYHPISENVVAGLGVYIPSGLGCEWEGTDLANITNFTAYEWKSKIGVITVSPALAFKLSEMLYFGATFNINYGMFDISTHAGVEPVPYLGNVDFGQEILKLKGWGFGATFGLLLKPSNIFSIGATFRTPVKFNFEGDGTISGLGQLSPLVGGATVPTTSKIEGKVTWPLWLAGGIALKPVENLILTADAQYTNWKKIDVIQFTFSDQMWLLLLPTEKAQMSMLWRNATQIRFGGEYRINSVAIRGGYYFDPSPAPDKTMNILVPNYDFNAFSVGFGIHLNGLVVDFALEYLKAKDRPIGLEHALTGAMPGAYTMKIWAPSVSVMINL